MGTDVKTLFTIRDGGLEEVRQGPRAEPVERRRQRLQGHRRGDRLVADLVHRAFQQEAEAVLGLAQDDVLPHVRAGGGGRSAVEIDEVVNPPLRHVDLHRAESGDAAHQRVDRRLDERAGDRRVDRVAAVAEHVRARLDRLGLGGGDDPLHGLETSGSPRSQ